MTLQKKIRDGFAMMLYKLERIFLRDTLDPLTFGASGRYPEGTATEVLMEEMEASEDVEFIKRLTEIEPFFGTAQKVYLIKDAHGIYGDRDKTHDLACMVVLGVRESQEVDK